MLTEALARLSLPADIYPHLHQMRSYRYHPTMIDMQTHRITRLSPEPSMLLRDVFVPRSHDLKHVNKSPPQLYRIISIGASRPSVWC